LRRELGTLQKHNICFRAIGRIQDLPDSVKEELRKAQEETRENTMMNLVIALNYSGRLELVDAVNSLLASGVEAPVSEEEISTHLYTAGLPDPDLLIRTSGEMRVSNFLLWQIAYSEIFVSDVLWPDFRGQCFLEAILEFQRRERRYGGIKSASYQST
jgi:undecaprenyl diphosphate synthase